MDENMRAISFANGYFALVDGLAPGLKSHLSQDVVLDWFGRTVKGRKNVCTFMETHKVNSAHRFGYIAPISAIGYKKKHFSRKKFCLSDRRDKDVRRSDDNDCCNVNGELFSRETDVSSTDDDVVARDVDRNEIDWRETSGHDVSYEFNEGDSSNRFKAEITSTNVKEIEQRINRIKLEEETTPSVRSVKRERSDGDEPVVVESDRMKYVEADGEIVFSRKHWNRDAWNVYFTGTFHVQTWRRPCKLQIAYTTLTECPITKPLCETEDTTSYSSGYKTRLPTLEEIGEVSNRLIPNKDDFGGFLKDVDFFEDRKTFLDTFETEMSIKEPSTPLFAPEYAEDKPILEKSGFDDSPFLDQKNEKKFLFNYQIHLIVYEGRNKCKMNLLHEFERTKL